MLVVAKTSFSNYVFTLCTCWRTGPRWCIAHVHLAQNLVTFICSLFVVTNGLIKCFENSAGVVSVYLVFFGAYFHSLVFNLFSSVTFSDYCPHLCSSTSMVYLFGLDNLPEHLNIKKGMWYLTLRLHWYACSFGIGYCLVIVVIVSINRLK